MVKGKYYRGSLVELLDSKFKLLIIVVLFGCQIRAVVASRSCKMDLPSVHLLEYEISMLGFRRVL